MSNNPANRILRLPPEDLAATRIPRLRQPSRNWFRVHQARFSPVYFSLESFHRFSHKDCPYPFLYLGVDLDTCLFERFGDSAYDHQKAIPQSLWNAHRVSVVRIPNLHVCDLTNAKTLSALMVDLSALMHIEVSAPQEWGLAIQRHPAHFQGIKYKSPFNGKACLALFQRDGVENRLREIPGHALANDDASADLLDKHKVSLY